MLLSPIFTAILFCQWDGLESSLAKYILSDGLVGFANVLYNEGMVNIISFTLAEFSKINSF